MSAALDTEGDDGLPPCQISVKDGRGSHGKYNIYAALAAGNTPKTDGVNSRLPEAFHNDKEPQIEIKYEKAVHRIMIKMAARGDTQKYIADACEMSPQHVSTILRQPWAREMIQKEISDRTDDSLEKLFEMKGKEAFNRLVMISEGAESEAVKLSATTEIVNRWLGKATTNVSVTKKPEEMSDAELAAVIANGRS